MDPLLDYYLCTKDGETMMVAAYGWDEGALEEYEDVQQLAYWQALQLTVGIMELDRSPTQVPELFSLAAFMNADDDRISELLGEGNSR